MDAWSIAMLNLGGGSLPSTPEVVRVVEMPAVCAKPAAPSSQQKRRKTNLVSGTERICPKCGQRPISEFSVSTRKGRVVYASYCRRCQNEYFKEYAKKRRAAEAARRPSIERIPS